MNIRDWLFIAALLLGGWHALGGTLPSIPSIVAPVPKVSAVVYVFEKDDTAVPNPVKSAINTLNRHGIVSTLFEDDVVDGTGQVPAQYASALEAARKSGLPCLVVLANGSVLRVVKNPQNESDVLDSVK